MCDSATQACWAMDWGTALLLISWTRGTMTPAACRAVCAAGLSCARADVDRQASPCSTTPVSVQSSPTQFLAGLNSHDAALHSFLTGTLLLAVEPVCKIVQMVPQDCLPRLGGALGLPTPHTSQWRVHLRRSVHDPSGCARAYWNSTARPATLHHSLKLTSNFSSFDVFACAGL